MKNRGVSTWLGLILGALVALALNATFAHAEDTASVTEEFHHVYPLTANGRVELENINGAVHISAWDQNQVKVDAVKRADDEAGLKNMEIRVDTRPDSLAISTKYHSNGERWNNNRYSSVEYTITVPRSARLDEIKLINGGLDVAGVRGAVHASCINGNLTARGLGNDVSLSTINGPLDASFETLAGHVKLESVNGPVQLTLPSDAKARIDATSVRGHIGNQFGLHVNDHRFAGHDLHGQLGSGGTEITIRNVNGPIEIRHANDGKPLTQAKSEDGDEI